MLRVAFLGSPEYNHFKGLGKKPQIPDEFVTLLHIVNIVSIVHVAYQILLTTFMVSFESKHAHLTSCPAYGNLQTADEPMCNIKLGTATAALLQDCAAIFWDEATMMNKKAVEALDRTLTKNNIPFGGVLMILSGDFRQTLPVIQGGARANQIDACL